MMANVCLSVVTMCNLLEIVLYIYEFRTTQVSLNDYDANLSVKNIIAK